MLIPAMLAILLSFFPCIPRVQTVFTLCVLLSPSLLWIRSICKLRAVAGRRIRGMNNPNSIERSYAVLFTWRNQRSWKSYVLEMWLFQAVSAFDSEHLLVLDRVRISEILDWQSCISASSQSESSFARRLQCVVRQRNEATD
ncbi:hypothetical protein PZA11_006066 [Diplocarpon coronariae]